MERERPMVAELTTWGGGDSIWPMIGSLMGSAIYELWRGGPARSINVIDRMTAVAREGCRCDGENKRVLNRECVCVSMSNYLTLSPLSVVHVYVCYLFTTPAVAVVDSFNRFG